MSRRRLAGVAAYRVVGHRDGQILLSTGPLTINGLRAVSVGSIRAFAEVAEYRLSCTAVQALLVAARGSTSSRPHAGCTQGIHMVGSFGVAYSTRLARINLARMMPLRYGEARWPQR